MSKKEPQKHDTKGKVPDTKDYMCMILYMKFLEQANPYRQGVY